MTTRLLYVADAFVHELQLGHPDWAAVFDTEGAETIATRRRLPDHGAARGALVAAFHVGRVGRVGRTASTYRLEPAS